jgi:transcriptional regulator with XRE-family HTH domain
MAGNRKDRDALAWFADELKAHRTARGWTQADIAAKAGYSESLIAQVETCRKAATPDLAKALDRVFGTPGFGSEDGSPGTFGRLAVRLRNLPFPASFRSFAPHEAEATAIYTFEHSLIPGLLQTEDYARAVLQTHPDVTEDVVSERLAGRLSRQSVLEREDPPPPLVCALIDQSVLMREIGGPGVMRDQLIHLATVSRRPSITVQVIPNTCAHPGLMGAFTVADLGGSPSMVNIEDIADGRVTDDAATVSTVTLRFHSLRGDALSKGASRELIESVIKERWKETAPSGAHQATAAPAGASV